MNKASADIFRKVTSPASWWSYARYLYVKRCCFEKLISEISKDAFILEIGGGYNPRFYKSAYENAYHLDHCDTNSLKDKYSLDKTVAHLIHQVQDVDFIYDGTPIEDIIPESLRFDYVYSSHALEHQVDIVRHFISLEKIVKATGKVILVVPDYRTCFDRFRFPTVASDAIAVYLRKQATHKGKQVYEFRAQCIDLNPGRMINRLDLLSFNFSHSLESAYKDACAAEGDSAAYRDVHAWTFTPLSFRLLMCELFLLGLCNLVVERLSSTFGNQFYAVLSACGESEREHHEISMAEQRLKLNKQLYL